tara:strand:- start:1752 stop:1862 length:111 start_codon:yes stop_codon:yes gene_type:complete
MELAQNCKVLGFDKYASDSSDALIGKRNLIRIERVE